MNDTVKINSGSTKMIAHRGLSGIERENTASAFVAAGNRSYYGIETDVHVTKDGKFAIIHDDTTGRVCNKDMSVEGSTLAELRALSLTERDGTPRGDLCVPVLDEYIEICARYGKIAVLELKNEMPAESIYEICEVIKKIGWLEHTIFISFALNNLIALREKYPDQPAQYLTENALTDEQIKAMTDYDLDLDIRFCDITKEDIEKLHGLGIKVNCWTCDEKADAERLISWGIDFITSNIIE